MPKYAIPYACFVAFCMYMYSLDMLWRRDLLTYMCVTETHIVSYMSITLWRSLFFMDINVWKRIICDGLIWLMSRDDGLLYINAYIFVFNKLGVMSLTSRLRSWTPGYLLRDSSLTFFRRCFCVMTTHLMWRPHFSATCICVDFISISIRTVDISFRRVETSKPKVWMDAVLYKITISVAPLLALLA